MALGTGIALLLTSEGKLPLPVLIKQPKGISQSTVCEAHIAGADWLSPDGKRVWVKARIGLETAKTAAVLVDLAVNDSVCLVSDADPVAWLSETEVLFFNEGSTDPVWKRVVRKAGGQVTREHFTRFYRMNLDSGVITPVGDIKADSTMTFCTVSTDRKLAVGAWGPAQCHEISIEKGVVSSKVDEKYVWSPCFIESDRYLFVGETAIQARRAGIQGSDRFSRPLLGEIRDAIKNRGAPSIEICGKVAGSVFVVDHVPDSRFDRLLKVDERTSVLGQVAQIQSSSGRPNFTQDGLYMAYQGNPFDRTWDTVYFQEVLEESKPQVLVEGSTGQVNEADPLILPDGSVLFLHRGTELRSIDPNGGEAVLHWPLSLLP